MEDNDLMDINEVIATLKDMYNRKINTVEYMTNKQRVENKKECEALKIALESLENKQIKS